MSLRTVLINTDSGGSFTWEREMFATIRAIRVDLETLTTPDVLVTDGVFGTEILNVSGLTDDAVYQPGRLFDVGENSTLAPPAVMGTLKVEVTNGGATKRGRLTVLLDR